MNDIMKIIKSIEESALLIEDVSETIKSKAKKQKARFISMLLYTLGASLLGNLLTGKGIKRSRISGQGVMRAGDGKMPPHPLTNFKI